MPRPKHTFLLHTLTKASLCQEGSSSSCEENTVNKVHPLDQHCILKMKLLSCLAHLQNLSAPPTAAVLSTHGTEPRLGLDAAVQPLSGSIRETRHAQETLSNSSPELEQSGKTSHWPSLLSEPALPLVFPAQCHWVKQNITCKLISASHQSNQVICKSVWAILLLKSNPL